jgi:hypothetical protein
MTTSNALLAVQKKKSRQGFPPPFLIPDFSIPFPIQEKELFQDG